MAIIENPVSIPTPLPQGGVIRQFTVHYPDGFTNGDVYDLDGAKEEVKAARHMAENGVPEAEGAYIMETMITVVCSEVKIDF